LPDNKPTIVFLSTYPPRECGIATFTQDLLKYSQKIPGFGFRYKVAAFNLSPLDTYKYPKEVEWEIDENSKKDYMELAKTINNDVNVSGIILQHEYGIFGGAEGEKILYFMENCKKPIVVTLHTALPKPGAKMNEVTEKIIHYARQVVVLTKNSKEIIEGLYPDSYGKIFIIPHGIHPVKFSLQAEYKKKLELENRIILSTFGLLSRNKGIKYVLMALPEVIKKYPSIIYLIIGETHPVIRRKEGEKYRLELAQLIKTLGLRKHVRFYDQYLNLPDLLEFLQGTDIYISTSINPNQAVSGTLSYALGTGRAVISTEFNQAKEMVTADVGKLVPIKDSPAMKSAILEMLGDPEKLKHMARNAYEKTRPMVWDNVAEKYTNLLARTIIPPLNLRHLYEMTDRVGLFQFAHLTKPNKNFGYTLDDNARALIASIWIAESGNNKKIRGLIKTYFDFMKKCQRTEGSFINYLGFGDNSPTSQNKSEDITDSHYRALWALGEVMASDTVTSKIRDEAKEMFLLFMKQATMPEHLRARAFAIKAYSLALKALPDHRNMLMSQMKKNADSLVSALMKNSLKKWIWFEKDLNYSNALLSESLLVAGDTLNDPSHKKKGIESLNFLIAKTFTPDMYMPIGQSHWYRNSLKRSQFDQQPEDPAAMILALVRAYKLTGDDKYKNLASKCFSWFLGNNSLNKFMYDKNTGGCYDGLHPDRVNLNQGAESLVSYLMSSVTMSKTH
jgi:glycosyltransferase involved in cell wall biosynthesis